MYSAGPAVYLRAPARFSRKDIGGKEVFDARIGDATVDFDAHLHQKKRMK